MSKNSIYSKIGELRNKIDAIKKDAKNPFFKSNYADINSIEKTVEPIEKEVGLTHMFTSSVDELGQLLTLTVADTESGDVLTSTLRLILNKQDMQQLISGHTYGRRGLLVSFYSLEAEDDDGNSVSGNTNNSNKSAPQIQRIDNKQIGIINNLVNQSGTELNMFCSAYNIQTLAMLPLSDFPKAVKQLEAKIKKANQ